MPAHRRTRSSPANRPRGLALPEQDLGRPRDERVDGEVVTAVLETLGSGGYTAVTINGIARKVGRARSTIYRRWPSRRHLVAFAVVTAMGHNPAAATGSLRGDLKATVQTLLNAFGGPLGRALPGLVADMATDAALAASIREEVLSLRRKSMREALARARARGELSGHLDIELFLDMLTGPFYYRKLFGHASVSRRMSREVVDVALRLVTSPDQEQHFRLPDRDPRFR